MFLECIDGVRRVYLWTVAGAPLQDVPKEQGKGDDYDYDDDEGEEEEEGEREKEASSSPKDSNRPHVPPLRPTVRELRKRFINGKSAPLDFE